MADNVARCAVTGQVLQEGDIVAFHDKSRTTLTRGTVLKTGVDTGTGDPGMTIAVTDMMYSGDHVGNGTVHQKMVKVDASVLVFPVSTRTTIRLGSVAPWLYNTCCGGCGRMAG